MEDLIGIGKSIKQARKIIEQGIGFCGKHIDKYIERKEDISTISQVSKEIKSTSGVDIKYNKNGITIQSNNNPDSKLTDEDIDNILVRAEERIKYQVLQEQKNIENVIKIFLDNLPSDNEISNKDIDPDWIRKYFKFAAEISNEKIQKIWALILSNKMISPNTCSLKTLQVLSNVRHFEASIFTNICRCVFKTDLENGQSIFFIPQDEPFLTKYGIDYEDILTLIDIGLIHPVTNLTYTHDMTTNGPLYIFSKNYKLVLDEPVDSDYNIKFDFPVYKLSTAGLELFNIINFPCNDLAINDYKNYINERYNYIKLDLLPIT